jgi:hypothetical protein
MIENSEILPATQFPLGFWDSSLKEMNKDRDFRGLAAV